MNDRRSMYKKKGKKDTSQATQIRTLSRQVANLKKESMSWAQYQRSVNNNDVAEPYFWDALVRPSEWSGIFQADDESNNANKFKCRSIGLEYCVSITSGGTPMYCTAFLVKLRAETSQQFCHETNYGYSLTAGTHYASSSTGNATGPAMFMLNKAYFEIINVDRFELGNHIGFDGSTQQVTTLEDVVHRKYIKIPYKALFKSGNAANSAELGWKQLTYQEVHPEDHLFLYIFNNANTIVDPIDPLESTVNRLSVSAHMVVTGTVPN